MPELDDDQVAKIGDAILAALRADEDLAAFFVDPANGSGTILDVELEDGYLLEGVQAPALLVAYAEEEETPQPGGWAELLTNWRITIVTAARNATGTSHWQRTRLVQRIKRVLWGEEQGMLRDPGNPDNATNRLTDAVMTFQRIGAPVFVDNTIRTAINVAWQSSIDCETREFIQ